MLYNMFRKLTYYGTENFEHWRSTNRRIPRSYKERCNHCDNKLGCCNGILCGRNDPHYRPSNPELCRWDVRTTRPRDHHRHSEPIWLLKMAAHHLMTPLFFYKKFTNNQRNHIIEIQ